MNAKEWRKLGYKTIFRVVGDGHATVYLFRPISDVVISTYIERGKWMDHDDVNKEPWCKWTPENHAQRPDLLLLLHAIAEECYCDMGVDTCDFCGGVRRPRPEIGDWKARRP